MDVLRRVFEEKSWRDKFNDNVLKNVPDGNVEVFYASTENVLDQQFLSMVRDTDDVLHYKIFVDEKN